MNSKQRRQLKREKYQWHTRRISSDTYGYANTFWCPHYTYEIDQNIDFYFVAPGRTVYCSVIDTVMIAYVNQIDELVIDQIYEAYPMPEMNFKKEFSKFLSREGDPQIEARLDLRKELTKKYMNSGDITVREQVTLRDYGPNKFGCFFNVAVNHFNSSDVCKAITWFRNRGYSEYFGDTEFSFTHDEIESYITLQDHSSMFTDIDIQNKSTILER